MDTPLQTPTTRRAMLKASAVAALTGAASLATMGLAEAATRNSGARKGDIALLNLALGLEQQAIWAYGAAAGKLTDTAVGNTVKALALRNQADHKAHRDVLITTIKHLGGTPVPAKSSYDLSAYIHHGEGNLDSDANIAKLALALEVDAVLAYQTAAPRLKMPELQAAALSILPDEAGHATAIRAVFHTLDASIQAVPSPLLSASTRGAWILKA